MNLYGLDYTLFDLGLADPTLIESLSSSDSMFIDRRQIEREEEDLLRLSNSILKNSKRNSSPPKDRHDGTSPLPLGMDWSPPPRNWDGLNTIWPHDCPRRWTYSVTVPSWSVLSESEVSEPVVFYRVEVGLRSPEGVTTTRGVPRRFSDFLKLSSDLKQSFSRKKLPPVPPKGLLRKKSRTLLEERRCSLEDWMTKVLSDLDFSRSAPVACFLELEAAVRSSFSESNHHMPDINLSSNSGNIGSSSDQFSSHTDVSLLAGTLGFASNYGSDSTHETSEIGSALNVKDNCSEFANGSRISDDDSASLNEATVNEALCENNKAALPKEFDKRKEEKHLHKFDERINLDKIQGASYTQSHHRGSIGNSLDLENSPVISHTKLLSRQRSPNDTSSDTQSDNSNLYEVHEDSGTSSKCSESVEASEAHDMLASSFQFSRDKTVVLQVDEQQKMNRLLNTMQQRFVTSKNDVEDLIARLNQELAVRQYLSTKVKDLETELESTKKSGKENLEQAIFIERERFTQMQWDIEEVRRKCVEMELSLKAEQDGKAHAEATKNSIIKENESLRQELDSAREQLKNLQKFHEEAELKSKADIKLLAKEIKSLRSSQSELRQELDRVAKERSEFETRLEKEKIEREGIDAANTKSLHECEDLRSRLEECNVNFLFDQENKLKMDALSPSDALEILATSDDSIGRLLAEARVLARDFATSGHGHSLMTTADELRKMLTDVLIDNTILRKQANAVMRCAFSMTDGSRDISQTAEGGAP